MLKKNMIFIFFKFVHVECSQIKYFISKNFQFSYFHNTIYLEKMALITFNNYVDKRLSTKAANSHFRRRVSLQPKSNFVKLW